MFQVHIENPVAVVATLIGVLATLFLLAQSTVGKKIFSVIPLVVFAYFIPTFLSNVGILPVESEGYNFIKKILLPASLILMTLSVDLPGIVKLGPKLLIMFFGGSLSVFVGAIVAYLLGIHFVPEELREQTWKGMAALCGSWIGGGANFIAVAESVGTDKNMMGLMVIVDVAVASIWMACLLYFAGIEKKLDQAIGATRTQIDELKNKLEHYKLESARPIQHVDIFLMMFLSISASVLLGWFAKFLPDIGTIINGFTWVVILVTALGVGLSFTRFRHLEGAGASSMGSFFLYLLIASIGAQGDFRQIVNAPSLVLIGVIWMSFHALCMFALRYWLKAPIFFLAVGSQANIGAAASAPIVASAFHPSLAPVGLMLALLGYVLGTYLALINAAVLQFLHQWLFLG